MQKKLALIFIFLFLSGCNGITDAGPTPLPEDYLPTVVALTADALSSSQPATAIPTEIIPPTFTPVPTITPSPTPVPTLTPTARPEIPLPSIRILAPGPLSKVVSPIALRGYVQPGADNRYQIELLGEDGRLLFREVRRHQVYLNEGVYTSINIAFETRAAAELGRLQISTLDEFGRPLETSSVHLLLSSQGGNDINIGDGEYARAHFFYPRSGQSVKGGVLPVLGEFQPFNDNQVTFELLSEEGKTLGLRVINMEAGVRASFETTIPYDVDEETSARLIIRQADEKFTGQVFIHSQIVILTP